MTVLPGLIAEPEYAAFERAWHEITVHDSFMASFERWWYATDPDLVRHAVLTRFAQRNVQFTVGGVIGVRRARGRRKWVDLSSWVTMEIKGAAYELPLEAVTDIAYRLYLI